MTPRIGLALLAAGASVRLGGATPKQALSYRGKSLLRHAAETACASSCEPIIVVLGANAERLQTELEGLNVIPILNPQWSEGMGASLRTGIAALLAADDSLDAITVMLCDQPLLTAAHLNVLIAHYIASDTSDDTSDDIRRAKIVASDYGETPGPPCLFDRSLFEELTTLSGDEGARRIIRRHAASGAKVLRVPFPEGALDIDAPEDYQRLLADIIP